MISLFVEYMYKIMSKYGPAYQQNLEAEMKDFAVSGLLIRMSIGNISSNMKISSHSF